MSKEFRLQSIHIVRMSLYLLDIKESLKTLTFLRKKNQLTLTVFVCFVVFFQKQRSIIQ